MLRLPSNGTLYRNTSVGLHDPRSRRFQRNRPRLFRIGNGERLVETSVRTFLCFVVVNCLIFVC